jgi:hypothetical protein
MRPRLYLYGLASLICNRYVVEQILRHKFEKGQILLRVKWLGYEKAKDQTWETEENL